MPISRREFCSVLGAAALLPWGNGVLADPPPAQPLRVIAYNVYECHGWPLDRPLAKKAVALKQMARRFAMELALYEPDIIALSESPSEELAKEIAKLLGMNAVRFPSGGKWPGTLMSRFPIENPQNVPLVKGERPPELFTRHWGRGTIVLPEGEKLIVHSAHLHPSEEPETRLKEIPLMIESMQADIQANRSLLLIGDLNHTPDVEEYKLWMKAGLVDTFAKVGEGKGDSFQVEGFIRRIDYIMASGPIAGRIQSARPLAEGAFVLNHADPQSFALSDHFPQFAQFGPTQGTEPKQKQS